MNNQIQNAIADMQSATKPFLEWSTPVINAADVLSFLQNNTSAATAAYIASIIPFAKCIPALSGNILELNFGNNNVDFAARLNVDFDMGLIKKINCNYYNLPFIRENLLTLIQRERNGFDYGIENIWIEYDAPFHSAPALFFDINRNSVFCPQFVYNSLHKVKDIFGWCINSRLLHFLEQVKQTGLQVVYYGLMFSRNEKSTRLTIKGIQTTQLIDTLKSLGWRGNYEVLEKFTVYLNKEQKIIVGVDFENNIKDRIGIEVFVDNQRAFIETLYNNQQISERHVNVLNSWPQCFKLHEHLSVALTQLHERTIQQLHTRINHFKFVIDSSEAVTVKAYLYYCF